MMREKALKLLRENLKNQNLLKHSLALEAVMRELAKKFGENPEIWGLAGLLHDLDYEKTSQNPQKHTLITSEILKKEGISSEIIDIIKAHNSEALGVPCETLAEKAIFAADPLTGLIVACALIHPDKKLRSITPQFVLNRFREKAFSRNASREAIKKCKDLGLSLEEFIEISLKAMQKISQELGL